MQPLRIAALQPSISIILDELGALDTLVACTRYCVEAVPALAALTKSQGYIQVIHDSWSASTDEILAARPDLVLASVPYRMESLAAILKAGCAVMTFAPKTLADIYTDTRLIGRLVDRSAQAEELVSAMLDEISAIRGKAVLSGSRPRVYCEEWGKPLIHSQTWVAELVESAGGDFIGTPGAKTDASTIAAQNPDVLLFAWCGAGDRVPLEKVVEQRGWGDLQAVREGRVYCITDEWLNTPATTLIKGLKAIARALHPGLFGAIQAPRSIRSVVSAASPSKL